jgi:ribose transport system substrate-binding protein
MRTQQTGLRGLLAVAIMVAAAGTGIIWPVSATARQDEDLRVAFATINMQNQFFVELNDGVQAAASEQGVEALLFDPNGEAIEQVNAIETYIQEGVDAIIVDAIDSEGIIPVLQQAEDAGIPVVAVDAVIDDPVVDAQVAVDDVGAGKEVGEFCAAYVDEQMGGEAQIGVILSKQSQLQVRRTEGFKQGVEEHPGITIVQEVDGGYAPDTSLTAAENLLTANPDLDIIYGTGEPAVLGAVNAARSQGRDDLKVCGWNLTDEIAAGIESGVILGTAHVSPFDLGVAALDAAVQLARGEAIEREVNVPFSIVTAENLDEFMEAPAGSATPEA